MIIHRNFFLSVEVLIFTDIIINIYHLTEALWHKEHNIHIVVCTLGKFTVKNY